MIRIAQHQFLLLFWIVPGLVLFFLYVFWRKTQAIKTFGNPELMARLIASTSRKRQWVKAILLIGSCAFLITAIIQPQIGTRLEEVKREGKDIIVAIDVSKSMLAEDISPSRLEKAKHEISSLIDGLHGDRIGIIVFAGEAFVQCPLTLDYGAAKLILGTVSPDLIPIPGTNISQALSKAIETFDQRERKYKVFVLITDGEDHIGDIEQYTEAAAKEGIVIYTVGIGSPQGVPIPEYDNQGRRIGYKKDSDGNTVISKLDETTLQKIAFTTNGKYYNATPQESELNDLIKEVTKGEKKELGSLQFTDFEDRFQYFLGIVVMLLIVETLLSERRKIRTEWKGRFSQE